MNSNNIELDLALKGMKNKVEFLQGPYKNEAIIVNIFSLGSVNRVQWVCESEWAKIASFLFSLTFNEKLIFLISCTYDFVVADISACDLRSSFRHFSCLDLLLLVFKSITIETHITVTQIHF